MNSKNQCIQAIKDLYESNSRIRSLLTAIGGSNRGDKHGINDIDKLLHNVDCRPCGDFNSEGNARAFLVDNPVNIVLCTNRLKLEDMEEVLVHELIHAYDYKFNHHDLHTCEGLAASEIRAAREAECYNYVKYLPAFVSSWCVKSRASNATNNLFPGNGSQCVNNAYDMAMKDHRPKIN